MTAVVVAFQQNPSTGLLYSLTIDGLDVAGQVPYDSIRVTEAGPGAVSSMAFTILDPGKLVTIADYAMVRMWDYTRDLPVFAGWVESQTPRPGYGGGGRDIDVTCYGVEALLDQIIVPAFTARTTDTDDAGSLPVNDATIAQSLAEYLPEVRALATGPTVNGSSNQAEPMANMTSSTSTVNLITNVTLDGKSIRAAMAEWLDNSATVAGNAPSTVRLTIDFWSGVRLYKVPLEIPFGFGSSGGRFPSDWATLTVVETTTGTAASSLRWTRDTAPGTIITAVYVKGGNAAGTGWVVGDTTKGRGEAYIDDSSITTEALRQAAALAILGRRGTGTGRGSLTLENYTPTTSRAGGKLTITNAALGWAAKSFVISQIDKTFQKTGAQNWAVSFFDIGDTPTAGRKDVARRLRTLIGTLN